VDFITTTVGFKVFGVHTAIEGPEKCFPNLASFRQVGAESEIAFSKKDETFQESQGILSGLRLPIPPRQILSPGQILSAFSGWME
jgi:hypothetical protein